MKPRPSKFWLFWSGTGWAEIHEPKPGALGPFGPRQRKGKDTVSRILNTPTPNGVNHDYREGHRDARHKAAAIAAEAENEIARLREERADLQDALYNALHTIP